MELVINLEQNGQIYAYHFTGESSRLEVTNETTTLDMKGECLVKTKITSLPISKWKERKLEVGRRYYGKCGNKRQIVSISQLQSTQQARYTTSVITGIVTGHCTVKTFKEWVDWTDSMNYE